MSEMEENVQGEVENDEVLESAEPHTQKASSLKPKAKPSVAEEKVDAKSLPLKSIVKIFVVCSALKNLGMTCPLR